MYNKFRKTMEFISIIFITGIIFLLVRNFIMSMEVENIGIYYLKVVFGIIIGMYIFIKSVLEKSLFQNAIIIDTKNLSQDEIRNFYAQASEVITSRRDE